MDSKKITLVLMVAMVFVPPLLTPPLPWKQPAGCLPSGGFCMFQPTNCCGNCGCLYPVGVCYGSGC
ncbi:hypothetical protein IMY05_C2024000300 [Salix suchowensis]|nr:hypothetical protein IMY05_C2024000300 [Salix suchowensis]